MEGAERRRVGLVQVAFPQQRPPRHRVHARAGLASSTIGTERASPASGRDDARQTAVATNTCYICEGKLPKKVSTRVVSRRVAFPTLDIAVCGRFWAWSEFQLQELVGFPGPRKSCGLCRAKTARVDGR